jgi:hypothetical protein
VGVHSLSILGYYADTDAQCQVFHVCGRDSGKGWSFLCPNGTVFNQQYFICDWWFNFDCDQAPSFYRLNSELGKVDPNQAAENTGASLAGFNSGNNNNNNLGFGNG